MTCEYAENIFPISLLCMIVTTKVIQDLLNFVIIPKIENAKSTPNGVLLY